MNTRFTGNVNSTTDLILAVDGGQTSTLALLATPQGEILGAGVGGPSNHVHEPGGLERMECALRQAIEAAFRDASLPKRRISSACFGMTGGAEVVPAVVPHIVECNILYAHDDAVTALAGASIAQPGVVVIAGTGTVAYGRTADGREAKASGWGYIMGDEGSGYDLGIMALRAASQALDGRGPETTLTTRIPAYYRKANLREVHKDIYSFVITRPQIAALAAVVFQAAEAGDTVAQALLARVGQHLARSALAVLTKLDALEAGMTVYPTGGVFGAGDWVLGPFKAVLSEQSARTTVKEPAFAPVVGALLIALQGAGVRVDDAIVARIQASLPTSTLKDYAGKIGGREGLAAH